MVCQQRGGGGQFWGHTIPPTGPTGEGASAGRLPGSNQDHIGCSLVERCQSGGFLSRDGVEGGHRKTLPWRHHK